MRYTTKLLHSAVATSNGLLIGNVIGATIDTQTWRLKYLTLNLSSEAARALNIKNEFRYPGVHYATACLPVSLIATYENGILKIDRILGQLGCKNGIIEC
jgi:hypothetical protein